MSRERLYLFDTTLRDGAQTPGIDFSLIDKQLIAELLDDLGLDYVEGGYPGANPMDTEFFGRRQTKRAKFTAFGRVKKAGVSVSNDSGLRALFNAEADAICFVAKSSDYQVRVALGMAKEGFDFLGWHFRGGKKWPRKKSLQKLRENLRPLTQRNSGKSLGEIITRANPILRGWYGYFRESHPTGLSGPDGWLRRRLRALLRKREKRPGFGRSEADSRRWPNRWFAAQGLFSLEHGSCEYG